MGRLQRYLRWANVILIFLTFFAYLSPYLHPETFAIFSVLGLFYPVLLLLNILFVIFWGLQQKRYALYSLGCILLGWGHFTGFVGVHMKQNTPPSQETALKVMSHNVFIFINQEQEGKRKHWDEAQVLSFYKQYQPDVWCIQEFPTRPKYAAQFSDLIQEKTDLKYVYHERGKGLAIFSRYPLTAVKMHYFGNFANGYLIADLEKEGRKVRLFNIHLQSNAVSKLADDVSNNGKLQEKRTWLKIKGMLGRYRRTATHRSNQAREIRARIQDSPHPIILCGDFNDVPLSYTYSILSKGLTDGFRAKGKGIGTTFRGSLPALRIDYILSSPEITPKSYEVIRNRRSDHFPVWSVLDLTGIEKH